MDSRKCSFCKVIIPPGTGTLLVKKDGSSHYFCGSKCEKNSVNLRRSPRKVKWITKQKKEA